MEWYEVKEQAAGVKRLKLLWFIYKLCGKKPVQFIVFFVTLFAFIGAPKIRKCSEKYLKIATGKSSVFDSFKHFLSYSYSLVDKIELFTDNYTHHKIVFENESDKQILFQDLLDKKGIYILCSHLGNIDAMRAFFKSGLEVDDTKVNLFLEMKQCQIFRNFVEGIAQKDNAITTYPVENIDITTSIELKDKLDKGEIVFIAGDRISSQNSDTVFVSDFLNHKVKFPIGAFKFGLIMDAPIYFVICTKEKEDKYSIHLKKFTFEGKRDKKLVELEKQYVEFLEKYTLQYPYQFYHFYDFFEN